MKRYDLDFIYQRMDEATSGDYVLYVDAQAQLQQSAERERVLREALEKIDDWTLDGTHDFKHTYTSPHPYDGPTLEEHTTTCRGCEADEQLQQVIDIIDAALAQSASKETDNV